MTNASGTPLAGIEVLASPQQGGFNNTTTTASSGVYTVTGLAAGSYYVSFSDPNNVYIEPSTIVINVNVTAGSTTTQNEALVVGGSITGTVTNASGTPVAGIGVDASMNSENWGATTTSAGHYSILVPPGGPFNLYFFDSSNVYISASTTIANVVAGVSTTQNETLVQGGKVTGTVTNATGSPLAGIQVVDTNPSLVNVRPVTTSTAGTYSLTDIPPGSNSISFSDPNNVYGYESVNVNVIAGGTSTQNETLVQGGTITGAVSNPSGAPLVGIRVQAVGQSSNGSGSAISTSSGTYTIAGLGAGSYTVSFSDPNNVYLTSSSTVNVTAGSTVTQNETLLVGGTVTGTVTNTSGTPLAGIFVSENPLNGPNGASATTTSTGTYSISGLASGTYFVSFTDPNNVYIGGFVVCNITAGGTTTQNDTLFTTGLRPTISLATITGTPSVGQTLTAVASGVTGIPTPTPSYQWFANGAPISGATSSTYVPVTSEIGQSITVTITETNSAGKPASATSTRTTDVG
ncbi:MAG: carboxypeptidase regulatory-like domain-containing protein, partial [Acidimicrobiaceae bacterium]|nr:carboxypeptidase regulatory-like domain-containing protein [Acidimicrobiaceae bacterium]